MEEAYLGQIRRNSPPDLAPTAFSDIVGKIHEAKMEVAKIKDRLNNLVGRLFGEGDTEGLVKASPHPAGAIGETHAELSDLFSELAMVVKKLDRLQELA